MEIIARNPNVLEMKNLELIIYSECITRKLLTPRIIFTFNSINRDEYKYFPVSISCVFLNLRQSQRHPSLMVCSFECQSVCRHVCPSIYLSAFYVAQKSSIHISFSIFHGKCFSLFIISPYAIYVFPESGCANWNGNGLYGI